VWQGGTTAAQGRLLQVRAKQIIWAAPMFIAARVVNGLGEQWQAELKALSVAPWITANLHVSELPYSRGDAPIAWDNVLMDSPSLGYIVSTHQQLKTTKGASVLTYYWPLSDLAPAQARQQLLEAPWQRWSDAVLLDLEQAHNDIRYITQRIDIWRNAHAMLRPTPGTLWGLKGEGPSGSSGSKALWERLASPLPNLHFAHSDLSGLSLFEEANYCGVKAAERVAKLL
jgi:hypothetical protein